MDDATTPEDTTGEAMLAGRSTVPEPNAADAPPAEAPGEVSETVVRSTAVQGAEDDELDNP